jgi:hypothetical protein
MVPTGRQGALCGNHTTIIDRIAGLELTSPATFRMRAKPIVYGACSLHDIRGDGRRRERRWSEQGECTRERDSPAMMRDMAY